MYGWSIEMDLAFNAEAVSKMNGPNVEVDTTLSGWKSHSSVIKSNVGKVNPSWFDTAVLLIITVAPPSIPPIVIQIPSGERNHHQVEQLTEKVLLQISL